MACLPSTGRNVVAFMAERCDDIPDSNRDPQVGL
jgi:hypothetical protein